MKLFQISWLISIIMGKSIEVIKQNVDNFWNVGCIRVAVAVQLPALFHVWSDQYALFKDFDQLCGFCVF